MDTLRPDTEPPQGDGAELKISSSSFDENPEKQERPRPAVESLAKYTVGDQVYYVFPGSVRGIDASKWRKSKKN
jgi:hypothetical protein